MRRSSPICALLTDYGSRDPYVGTMKGVMLSVNPDLTIVDITHEVEPQNVRQAGYLLWASYSYFPSRTVFLCVVDPGVGTERTILRVETRDHTFIAPDNGLLDLVLSRERHHSVYSLDVELARKRSVVPPNISSTFHGRDVFAPIAGHLSLGENLGSLFTETSIEHIACSLRGPDSPDVPPSILHIDRFGNMITNILVGEHVAWKAVKGVVIRGRRISRWIRTYAEAPAGAPCMIVGSSGLLEIVARNASAAGMLRATTNTPIRILAR